MEWERARSEEQKEHRVREIMDAALAVYEEAGFEKLTYALIADKNGSARSNIYKYFSTKEEIFLEILRRNINEWSLSVQSDLNKGLLTQDTPAERFSRYWLDRFYERQGMTTILSMLHTTLEKNVPPDALVQFQRGLKESYDGLIRLLTEYGIFPDEERSMDFLLLQQALIQGCAPHLPLTGRQAKEGTQTGWPPETSRYEQVLHSSLTALIRDLRVQREPVRV